MKKTFFLLILVLCQTTNAQKSNQYLSSWFESIDDELIISSDKYICNNKGKVCYFISNDKDNLSIDILFNDGNAINRVLREGMTVWIDMDAKQTKKMGVKYPLGAQFSRK